MLPCPRSRALEQSETMNKIYDIGDVIGAWRLVILKKSAKLPFPHRRRPILLISRPGGPFALQAPYKNRLPALCSWTR